MGIDCMTHTGMGGTSMDRMTCTAIDPNTYKVADSLSHTIIDVMKPMVLDGIMHACNDGLTQIEIDCVYTILDCIAYAGRAGKSKSARKRLDTQDCRRNNKLNFHGNH